MKCSECKNCIITNDEKYLYTARCSLMTKRKAKLITWAMTTVTPSADSFSIGNGVYMGHVTKKTSGKIRAKESLKKKKSAPSWCPLLKGENNE